MTGTPFLNENTQQLAFTGSYQLAMANAGINPSRPNYTQGVNTNDSQFFITKGSPNQVLGYGYTIFGQMVAGQDVIAKMTKIPLIDDPNLSTSTTQSITRPANPLVMTSLSLSATNPSGVAIIDTSQARPGDTATFQVTATDAAGSVNQSFTVTAGSYSTGNNLPLGAPSTYFKPFANAATANVPEGSSTTVTANGTAGYPYTSLQGTLSYSLFAQPAHGTVSNFNATTGTFTYTPNPGYSGTDSVQVAVHEVGETPFLGYIPNTTNPIFGAASTATTAATTSNPATVTITVTPTPTPTTPTPTTPTPTTPTPTTPTLTTPTPTTPTPTAPTPTPTAPTPTPPPPPLVTVTGVVDVTNKKHQVTAIHVTYSGAVNSAEAANAATYQLIKQGKHKAFVVSRKSTIAIKSASYDPTNNQVTLIPAKPFALSKPVEVLISGEAPSGLQDAESRLIDGNRDGQPGGNATSILSKGGARVAIVTAAPSLAAADAVDDLVAQSAADGLAHSQAAAWMSPHDKARRH